MKNKDETFTRLIKEATKIINEENAIDNKVIEDSRQAMRDGTHPSINYKEYERTLNQKQNRLDQEELDEDTIEKVLDFQYGLICDAITNLDDIVVPNMGSFKVFPWLKKIYDSKVENGEDVSIKELYIEEKKKRHPSRRYGRKMEEARKNGTIKFSKAGQPKPKLKRLF